MKKVLYYLFLVIIGIFICYFGIKYVKNCQDNKKTISLMDKAISNIDIPTDSYLEKYVELRKYYSNDDIVGRLVIEGLNIDTILTQGSDNSFYLYHNLYKEYNALGNVFLDYRESLIDSKQINIYGHDSSVYYIPFSRLKKYLNYEFYLNNSVITLESENGISKYKIFAVNKVRSNDEEHIKIDFNSLEEWDNHFQYLKSNSIYDTSVEVNSNDNILILQTCLFNNPEESYLIINAKKIEEE